MQHFIGYPTNSEFICGTNAVGRRHTRRDSDPTLTECAACKSSTWWKEAMAANTPAPECTGRNGSYKCQKESGHRGDHAGEFRTAGRPFLATWTDAYSALRTSRTGPLSPAN